MNLSDLTDAEVIDGLKTSLNMTAEGYRRAAPFYVEAVERGYSAAISTPILARLPDVAAGRLSAELLVLYGSNPPIMDVLSGLVPEEQARLVKSNGKVPLLESSGVRNAAVLGMTLSQLRQVIGDGVIRPPEEQRRFLSNAPPPPAAIPEPPEQPESRYDIRAYLTEKQMTELTTAAERVGLSPGALLIRWAVSRGKIRA